MTVGSLFSGIGGIDLGLELAGMKVVWQVENDEFCRKALRKHWPGVKLYGDIREIQGNELEPVDLICGGFPCQDLSVAGKRAGLAGERSGLFYEFTRIIDELTPRWVLIENVPGLLSSNGGRDMGAVLGTLAELGYWWAYRVLDAQYFGVAQRRRRVFIVGHRGDGRYPTQVLFEPESCAGDTPPSKKTRQVTASLLASGAGTSRTGGAELELLVDYYGIPGNWIGRKPQHGGNAVRPMLNISPCLTGADKHAVAPALSTKNEVASSSTQRQKWMEQSAEMFGAVRRLTPLECERLQGFPDGWTAIDGENTPDSPRYKAIGNAVCVNVAEWIGRRIIREESA